MQSASEKAEGQKIFPMMQTSLVSEQKAEAVSWDSSEPLRAYLTPST